MATPKPSVVTMRVAEGGLAGSMACRPSSRSLLPRRVSPGLSLVALRDQRLPARFTSILSAATPRPCITVASIHATDPDFYNIPYVQGIPVGKRLKLWNLPPNCKHSELLEWFSGVDVVVQSLEFTDDPTLNTQGIGGFVEFATKQDACIAIVRLDGYKFRGHYIRMDFSERRPRPRDYGSRRSRPNHNNSSHNNSSRVNSATSARPSVTHASSDQDRIPTSADMGPPSSSSSGEDSSYGVTQSSPVYGSSLSSTDYGAIQSPAVHVTSAPSYTSSQSSPSYVTGSGIPQPTGISESIGSTSRQTNFGSQQQALISNSDGSLQGSPCNSSSTTTTTMQSVNSIGNHGFKSGYESSIPQSAASVNKGTAQFGNPTISSQNPAAQGHSPNSPHSWDPYEEPFKSYGAPEQGLVEPWSNKTNFRSGPMYGSPQPSSFNRLFVGNLALSVNDATLQQLFSRFGTVLEARVLRELESGRSRGFGVVAMSRVEEVKAAFEALDGWLLDSRPIRVDVAMALKH